MPGSFRGCPACFGHGQGRNLRTGEPVDIRYKGKRGPAAVEVLTQEPDVVEHYAIIAATTTPSPGSTRSVSTGPSTPIPPTCTWPGPRAPESSGGHRADRNRD